MIGFDGIYRFDSEDLHCSTIVQPRASLPALVCLPVSYRPGGTTKDGG